MPRWSSKLSEWGVDAEDVELALAGSEELYLSVEEMGKEIIEYWRWEVENIGAPGQLGGTGAPVAQDFERWGGVGHWVGPQDSARYWDEPGDYRDSIGWQTKNAFGEKVPGGWIGSDDYKAGWLEYGSAHNPEYGYGAKVMEHFEGRMVENEYIYHGFNVIP